MKRLLYLSFIALLGLAIYFTNDTDSTTHADVVSISHSASSDELATWEEEEEEDDEDEHEEERCGLAFSSADAIQ